MPTRFCIECGETKTAGDFRELRNICRACERKAMSEYGKKNREKRNARLRAYRKKHPDKARLYDKRGRYKYDYGLTLDEVDELMGRYDGKCWICRTQPAKGIDHCHTTGKVRGALCANCNTFLGRVEKIGGLLDRMRAYLLQANED